MFLLGIKNGQFFEERICCEKRRAFEIIVFIVRLLIPFRHTDCEKLGINFVGCPTGLSDQPMPCQRN